MVQILVTAFAVYVATSIDYFMIIMLYFSKESGKSKRFLFVIGHYLGMLILYAISLFSAMGVQLIGESWIIGLLGLVPLAMGIMVVIRSGKIEDESEYIPEEKGMTRNVLWRVMISSILLTLASGGDDLGVFIPLFATYSTFDIISTIGLFLLFITILCFISNLLSKRIRLPEKIRKHEWIIESVVYIALGIYILWENETLLRLYEWIF